jgi:hypothetical protein
MAKWEYGDMRNGEVGINRLGKTVNRLKWTKGLVDLSLEIDVRVLSDVSTALAKENIKRYTIFSQR